MNKEAEEIGKDAGEPNPSSAFYSRRHLRFGWWSLLFFLSLGIFLEMLHGFKIGWYLDVSNEIRRLMLTLAHTHGTLLALVHVGAGATLAVTGKVSAAWDRIGSNALIAASALLPGGFLLGGIWIYEGDPGYGIFLVPLGAIGFFAAVYLMARQVGGK